MADAEGFVPAYTVTTEDPFADLDKALDRIQERARWRALRRARLAGSVLRAEFSDPRVRDGVGKSNRP